MDCCGPQSFPAPTFSQGRLGKKEPPAALAGGPFSRQKTQRVLLASRQIGIFLIGLRLPWGDFIFFVVVQFLICVFFIRSGEGLSWILLIAVSNTITIAHGIIRSFASLSACHLKDLNSFDRCYGSRRRRHWIRFSCPQTRSSSRFRFLGCWMHACFRSCYLARQLFDFARCCRLGRLGLAFSFSSVGAPPSTRLVYASKHSRTEMFRGLGALSQRHCAIRHLLLCAAAKRQTFSCYLCPRSALGLKPVR